MMYRRHSFIENEKLYMSHWLACYIWGVSERELRKIHRASELIGKHGSAAITEALKYCADELMILHAYACRGQENHDILCQKIRGEVPGFEDNIS